MTDIGPDDDAPEQPGKPDHPSAVTRVIPFLNATGIICMFFGARYLFFPDPGSSQRIGGLIAVVLSLGLVGLGQLLGKRGTT